MNDKEHPMIKEFSLLKDVVERINVLMREFENKYDQALSKDYHLMKDGFDHMLMRWECETKIGLYRVKEI